MRDFQDTHVKIWYDGHLGQILQRILFTHSESQNMKYSAFNLYSCMAVPLLEFQVWLWQILINLCIHRSCSSGREVKQDNGGINPMIMLLLPVFVLMLTKTSLCWNNRMKTITTTELSCLINFLSLNFKTSQSGNSARG